MLWVLIRSALSLWRTGWNYPGINTNYSYLTCPLDKLYMNQQLGCSVYLQENMQSLCHLLYKTLCLLHDPQTIYADPDHDALMCRISWLMHHAQYVIKCHLVWCVICQINLLTPKELFFFCFQQSVDIIFVSTWEGSQSDLTSWRW